MLKAVIFDLDGVIIDSEPLHMKSTIQTLKEFDISPSTEYLEKFIGTTTETMFKKIIEDYNLPVALEDILAIDAAKTKTLYESEGMTPIPGVTSLIERLFKAGYKLGIASSSSMRHIETVAKKFNITKYFHKFVSAADVKNPKPAPDVFLKALKELGVNALESLIIEDSYNGCIAAKAAGIPCIGYINPGSGNQDLFSANVVTESLGDLEVSYLEQVHLRANGLPLNICTTKNLMIRELTVDDIKTLYSIYQNKQVREYIDDIDDYLEIEIEKHKTYIKNVYAFYGFGLWGIFSKTTKKLIGRCGIQNQVIDGKQQIEISYMLDKQHWGYGYALECCKAILAYSQDELKIPRIVAVIDQLNLRSIKLAEKLGMKKEKDLIHRDRKCFLYAIDLSAKQYLNAKETAVLHYKKMNY